MGLPSRKNRGWHRKGLSHLSVHYLSTAQGGEEALRYPPSWYGGHESQHSSPDRDEASGNDYMHIRYYGSSLGRFMKPDNIVGSAWNPQSWNLYSYVNGNPVNMNDPTGHTGKSALAQSGQGPVDQMIAMSRLGGNVSAQIESNNNALASESAKEKEEEKKQNTKQGTSAELMSPLEELQAFASLLPDCPRLKPREIVHPEGVKWWGVTYTGWNYIEDPVASEINSGFMYVNPLTIKIEAAITAMEWVAWWLEVAAPCVSDKKTIGAVLFTLDCAPNTLLAGILGGKLVRGRTAPVAACGSIMLFDDPQVLPGQVSFWKYVGNLDEIRADKLTTTVDMPPFAK